MAGRIYDVVERLKAKNERPIVKIDDDHTFTINTSKTNVLCINAMQKQGTLSDEELMDKIIEMGLGTKALEYINTLDLTMEAISDVIKVIIAGISNVDIEEIDKQEEKEKGKSFQK